MKQLNFGSTNGVPNNPNKTVVHCPAQELAQKVLRISDRWSLMDYWYDKESETCFDLMNDDYGTVEGYSEAGYTILPAEEFIRLNTEVKNPFKIGDRVFHHLHLWGIIENLDGQCCHIDAKRGYYQIHYKYLSFTEYILQGFSQERPKPEIKEGQLIYVRFNNDPEEWKMRFFSHWEGSDLYFFRGQHKNGQPVKAIEYSLTNPLEEK